MCKTGVVCVVIVAAWMRVDRVAAQPTPKPDTETCPVTLPNAEAFSTRQTDHFLIWYDTSYEVLRPLVNRLEGTYDAVTRVGRAYGFPMDDLPEPLHIVLLETHDDYAVLARNARVDPRGAAGFFSPGDNISIFGNIMNSPPLRTISDQMKRVEGRLSRIRKQGRRNASTNARARSLGQEMSRLSTQRDVIVKRFNRVVIQHEAAHQIFFNLGVHRLAADNPTWLVEGLATQFEVAQSSARKGLHRVNQMRLGDLRESAGFRRGQKKVTDEAYAAAFGTGRLVPLETLIADDNVLAGNSGHVSTVYAQSWALVYYLARAHEEAFSGYLARVAARPERRRIEPQVELEQFSEFFGPVNAAFERGWLAYMMGLRFDPAAD